MNSATKRHMIVFDSAYTYEMLVQRNVSVIVTAKDLDGYFDHVWTVHPVAGLLYSDPDKRYGVARLHALNERHTVVEGKIGRYKGLKWLAPLNFLLAQWQLIRFLKKLMKEQNMRYVRAEDPYLNGIYAFLFSRWFRRPLMIGVWGNPGAIRKYTGRPIMPRFFKWVWLEEKVEKYILGKADCVIVQNEDNRQFVISRQVPESKVAFFRVGSAIYDGHFSDPERRTGGREELNKLGVKDEKVLICISRLERLKLTDHLVRATAILKKRGWKIKALFVGDGSFRSEMETLADEMDVKDSVIFCGNRSQTWLAQVIPVVDAVISPLTGRALAEAALGGVPVVAYDIDWQGEVIQTGRSGELVPYLDYEQMAERIEKLLKDPAYAREMGRNVRNVMMELMDPVRNNEIQIRTYESLLTGQAKPSPTLVNE